MRRTQEVEWEGKYILGMNVWLILCNKMMRPVLGGEVEEINVKKYS